MYCGKCGKQNAEGVRYCVHCGADLAQQTPLPPSSTPPAETLEDTEEFRRELLDAGKSPGQPKKSPPAPPRKAKVISADAVGVGKTLASRYKLTDRLGVGGMGEVFKAVDLELNDLAVAIKILPPILAANTRSVNRLRTEAAISLKLTHPNICRLHTFRIDGDVKFLVMEYIPGQTLEEMLDGTEDRKLPLAKILPIARNVADALDFAHSQNPPILHRDIKPSNVMVTPNGVGKVLDFGIARELKDSMTRMTGKDTSGTLLYMSPEQFTGSTPTAASDIYSFAAMLYECLCGHAPFWQGSIAHQLLNQNPTRIPNMPGHVNDALNAGLAKNSGDRPASARELVRLLEGRDKGAMESSAGVLSPGKGAHAAPPRRHAPEADDPGPAPKPRPPKGRTHPRRPMHTLVVLLVLLAALAGAAYWQGWLPEKVLTTLGLKSATTPQPAPRTPRGGSTTTRAGNGPKVGRVDLDAAIAAQQDAEASWARVKNVSDANHFDRKLKAVEALLATGTDQITKTQYAQAIATYKNAMKRCSEIAALDGERQQSAAARIEMDKARQAAETAGAATLAAALWQGAESTSRTASGLFEADRFTEAAAAWGRAQKEYHKATTLAALGAKVQLARKAWDDGLKTADQAVLTQYGGRPWLEAQAAQAEALAAGTTEQAAGKWEAAAKLLRQAWQLAAAEKGKAETAARHIETARTLLAEGKCAEARKETAMALAVIPDHKEATFLAAKADAGTAIAEANALLEAKPAEALAAVRKLLPKLKRLADEAPSDAALKAWLAEADTLQTQLVNLYMLARRLTGHAKAVVSVDVHADGAEFVTGSPDGTVKIWATATGKVLKTIETGRDVTSAVYSPDGARLAWAAGAKLMMAARADSAAPAAHEGHLLAILAVAFSPAGKTVVTCGEDNKLLVRDADTGKITATLDNKDDVTCLAFSPDGKLVVSGSGKLLVGEGDKLVRIWDLAQGKCLHMLEGHGKTVRAVAFSSDGKQVASADDSGLVLIHDAATGKEAGRLTGHHGAVSGVAFRQDGLRLASAGADKTVRLWDPATGKCTQVLEGHTDAVRALRFSPDGKRLISTGDDQTIIIWALGLESKGAKAPEPRPGALGARAGPTG